MNQHEFHELQMPLEDEPLNLDEIARVRAIALFEKDARCAVRAVFEKRLYTRKTDERNDRFAEDEGERAASDIKTLNTGNWRNGFWEPKLRSIAQGPGIVALERFIARCDETIARQRRKLAATWPAPYRFTGEPGLTVVNSKVLKTGDVVMLNEAEATAWADRF